jgi:hypothetical protein
MGALAGRHAGSKFPVVSAVAKLTDENGKEYCAIVYEGLYDATPHQFESLLAVHQCRRIPGNAVDDCATTECDTHGRPGTQRCRISGHLVPFYYDGTKCYYKLSQILDNELTSLPRLVFTPSGTYDPLSRTQTRRLDQKKVDWKYNLGFPPDKVVTKTLAATTQMTPSVETETREIMRDHLKTRLPGFIFPRRNDIVYMDTFFSSVTSVRGYSCFQLYSFKNSGFDLPVLMRRRSQAPTTILPLVQNCGIPHTIKSDNAPEFIGKAMKKELRRFLIDHKFTEPHHPNENLSERRGGMLKHAVVNLLQVSDCPLIYWCYAVEFLALARQCTARRSLNWRTPHEKLFGDTPDISVFRFPFYCPVWFYTPQSSFPKQRMMPARFLGIAQNSGDAFTYIIVTTPSPDSKELPVVLTRSVIRRRYPQQAAPLIAKKPDQTLVFFRSDGKTPLDDVFDEETPLESEIVSPESETDDNSPHGHGPEEVYISDPVTDYYAAVEEVYGPVYKKPRLIVSEELDAVVPLDASPPPQEFEHTEAPLLSAPTTLLSTTPNPTSDTKVHPPSTPVDSKSVDLAKDPRPPDSPNHPNVPLVTQNDDTDGNTYDDPILDGVTPDEEAHHLEQMADLDPDDEMFDSIISHCFDNGVLQFEVKWRTEETSILPFSLVKLDFPLAAAKYIRDHKVGCDNSRFTTGRYQRWSRSFLRRNNRLVRRILRHFGYHEETESESQKPYPVETADGKHILLRRAPASKSTGVRRPSRKRKKPGRTRRPLQVKYGIAIPRNVNEAFELDAENGNKKWADAIEKEISTLLALNCFTFHGPGYKPGPDYQFAPLRMIFEVKQDGRQKCRLIAQGHVVDSSGISTRSTVVKGISVRLLDLIAHRDKLKVLCGDVGNAFVTANCLEKIWSRAGPEFGERCDSIVTLNKALYGLSSSSRAFRATFADFLRRLGFVPTRYDRDVWMRLRESKDGYDYICTHVDDFKVIARAPERWTEQIAGIFHLKSVGSPTYYLGNDYHWNAEEGVYFLGCNTYIKECLRRIEALLPDGQTLYKKTTPLPADSHPELDDSPLLDQNGVQRYQTLIGMAQWAVTVGRLDISFAVSSLSRFSANPREHHLELALYLFGYLKQFPNRRISLDSNPLLVDDALKKNSFHPDFLEDYPDAKEEVDPGLPTPYGDELETSVFFDADHAHDIMTRRSISGLIVFVGSTPVLWISRRQGCIATSTYCAEFIAMRTAVEEAISLRYMLRCLGVPVTAPTNLYGDNFGVIQSATIPEGELKKKHIAISYHYVREAIAAKVVNGIWVRTDENFADVCTKALGKATFSDLTAGLMV